MAKDFKTITCLYHAGDIIFKEGDESNGIFSITRGQVSITKNKFSLRGYVPIEIAKLGPGSVFGEMGMFGESRREASVKAIEDTEVLVITDEVFDTQMDKLPPWVVSYIKTLVSRLRITNEKLMAALDKDAKDINASSSSDK